MVDRAERGRAKVKNNRERTHVRFLPSIKEMTVSKSGGRKQHNVEEKTPGKKRPKISEGREREAGRQRQKDSRLDTSQLNQCAVGKKGKFVKKPSLNGKKKGGRVSQGNKVWEL